MSKKKGNKKPIAKKEQPIKLDMSFTQAMIQALNTPLPAKAIKR